MEPLRTLFESSAPPATTLPDALAAIYDGGLAISDADPGASPYVIANFVETLDGVVSFAEPGHAGGGDISGNSEPDHFIMGLLRAYADAVIFGTGTLHGDAGHVRTASFIYPARAEEYRVLRRLRGRTAANPLNVVVSASGRVDLNEPTFHTADLRAVIATTTAGSARLERQRLPAGVEVRVVPPAAPATTSAGTATSERAQDGEDSTVALSALVDPTSLLDLLARDYGVRIALHEGGPTLFGAFLAANRIDELFLTLAPQFAGRDAHSERPAMVEGHAFAPVAAPWASLVSIKQSEAHVFLRYDLNHRRPV